MGTLTNCKSEILPCELARPQVVEPDGVSSAAGLPEALADQSVLYN
jgi:hypothetical protein